MLEAEGKESLARGMKRLEVRLARAGNRIMRRTGRVFGDRYHAHVLKTPREAARALRYVLMNFARHARAWGENISATFIDPFSSVRYLATSPGPAAPVAGPLTWLLRVGCHGSGRRSASTARSCRWIRSPRSSSGWSSKVSPGRRSNGSSVEAAR